MAKEGGVARVAGSVCWDLANMSGRWRSCCWRLAAASKRYLSSGLDASVKESAVGQTSPVLTDNFGRHHNYLRISLTERCNLRCK